VGRTLGAGPGLGYIHEPFNVDYVRPGLTDPHLKYWFTHVWQGNEHLFRPHLSAVLSWQFSWRRAMAAARGPADLGRIAKYRLRMFRNRRARLRPLLKDPIALLSAEYLASEFHADVVVMIRHPAAFVASHIERGWRFPFGDLLAQERLMDVFLGPFAGRMEAEVSHPGSEVEHAALVWAVLYAVVSGYSRQHPNWLFLRHEDLARQPMEGFRGLADHIAVPFSPQLAQAVQRNSFADRGVQAHGDSNAIRRDSAAVVGSWRERLPPSETVKIRRLTEGVSEAFYSGGDW